MRMSVQQLRALARYQTHGGYTWAAVMDDGELLCVPCVRSEYRQILTATRRGDCEGWTVEGITHSGEAESTEYCAHCNKPIWSIES